jgi:hypothetical protein
MNDNLVKICFGSGFMAVGSVLIAAMTGTPDTKQIIPYPEVVNLQQVPKFDSKGKISYITNDRLAPRANPDRQTKKNHRQQERE